VSQQFASWDTTSEMGTKALLLHPFKPLVCVADDKETIRYLTPSFIVDG
jgi:regulator-associated protein of mTOR